jgi:hypothetical protein
MGTSFINGQAGFLAFSQDSIAPCYVIENVNVH